MSDTSLAPKADRLAYEGGILNPNDRVALLRNKTAILDALQATGIASLIVSFEELPFGSYIDKIEVHGAAGRCALPAMQLHYAYPDRERRFRHMKASLRDALYGVLNAMLGDARDSALPIDGTLHIDLASRTFDLAGRGLTRPFHRVY